MRTLASLLVGVLVAAAASVAVAVAGTSGIPTITVAVPRSAAAVPFELGVQRGIFKANGVNVRLVLIDSTAQAIAAVTAGKAEIGVGDPTSIMVYANAKHAPLRLVSGVTTTKRGFTGLLATGGIKSAAGTFGMKVGVPELDGLDRLATQVWLDGNGGDTNSVTFVQVASRNARRALAKGYVNAVLVEQPVLASLATAPGVRSLGDVENGLLGSQAPDTVAFSTSTYLRSSAGSPTAVRFVRALGKAIAYASGHRSAVTPILTSVAGWPAALAGTMTPQYSATLGTFTLEQIAESEYAYQLTGAVQPDVAALVWSKAPQRDT